MARTEASTGNKGGSSKSNIGAAGRKARKTPPKKKGGNAVGANVVAPVGTQRVGRAKLIAHPVPLA